jgi:hypothetical protein
MFKKILLTACTVLLSGALMAAENPRVVLETNLASTTGPSSTG